MQVKNAAALGAASRARRKELHLTLRQLAGVAGVSVRFLSEFENGRATAGIGLVLKVLATLSLDVTLSPRGEHRR